MGSLRGDDPCRGTASSGFLFVIVEPIEKGLLLHKKALKGVRQWELSPKAAETFHFMQICRWQYCCRKTHCIL